MHLQHSEIDENNRELIVEKMEVYDIITVAPLDNYKI